MSGYIKPHYDCKLGEEHPGEPAELQYQFAENGWADHVCTACHWAVNDDVQVSYDYKYCPNCGAKFINQFKWHGSKKKHNLPFGINLCSDD